jgi:phospholipid/cholesterol/gamma-HCH transport system substrate-binding protein
MKSERKAEIIVGLTVVLAIIILILGIMWGKDQDFAFDRTFLTVRFDDVRGLEKGDQVLIRGVKQGEVDRIDLKFGYAEVRLWVRGGTPLCSDMQIAVEMEEMMGGKQVVIDPGKNGQPADLDKIFMGKTRGDAVNMLVKAEEIIARADTVFTRFSYIMDADQFSRVLQNVEETTDQMRGMLAENRQSLRRAVVRLEKMTEFLEEDSTVFRAGGLITRLDSTVMLMKSVAVRLEKEEGTLGKLVRDRWLYDQLIKTTSDLDSLITDIKANPKKYIHVSLF